LSEERRKAWNYTLDAVLILGLSVPLLELLAEIPGLSLKYEFYLLYLAAFFISALLFETTGHRTLTLRILPALPVAVLLISRDMVLFLNALIALVVFGLVYLLISTSMRKWIISAALLVFLILWIPREGVSRYVAGCLILLVFAVVSEWMKGERKSWLILLGLSASIAFMIPSSEEPLRWEGFRRMIAKTEEFFDTTWKNLEYFFGGFSGGEDTAYAGYSETGGLAGELSGSDTEELSFSTVEYRMPVYLNGAAYAKLGKDGFSERVEPETPVNGWFAMYLSALAGSGVNRLEASCFSRVGRAEITYAYIRTGDLLLPSTVFMIDEDLRNGLDHQESKGFTYSFNYFTMDNGSPYFRRLAMRAGLSDRTASYEEAEKAAKDIYNLNLRNFLSETEYYECLEKCARNGTDPQYLDTSMSTDRIRTLTEELTGECKTDMEKALRIEAYLRQYEYDMATDLRGKENYVDSFLFEVQKGYCVHYSSAMVVMLRQAGVPARFVQGFMFTPDEEGTVYGSQAHAWVEAYMSGLGWVRFEPTSAMENADDTTWGYRLPEKEEEDLPELLPEEKEEEIEPPKPPVPAGQQEAEEDNGETLRGILATVGSYMLVILGVAAALFAGYLLARRIRYLRLTPEEKLKENVERLRRKLDKKLPPGERAVSVYDYLPFVEDEEVRSRMEELFRAYYRVRFRGDPADPQLIEEMRRLAYH